MYDYLIVGLGLAGIAMCETLEKHEKSFLVISDQSQQSSRVAAGLYNPVILKRFKLAWKADEQMPIALNFYRHLEQKLDSVFDDPLPVLRRLASVEEQNLWFEAADGKTLKPFMSGSLVPNTNDNLDAPHGFGKVVQTGRIDTKKLIDTYSEYLRNKGVLRSETFRFEDLKIGESRLLYNDLSFGKVVFATGFGLKKNPYFNYLPLQGTKGEVLTIRCPELKARNIVKAGVFCIPLGNDFYRVGATYKWKDKSDLPTEEAKAELQHKLELFLKCPYELIDHVAAVRPTVSDRRPLVGQHPAYEQLFVLNGMGSRGLLIAPYVAELLYEFMSFKKALPSEIDIARFKSKYKSRD